MTRFTPRECSLILAILVLTAFLLAGRCIRLIPEANAQSEAGVQSLLSQTPNVQSRTIWGDGQGNVFVSDGLGLYRSDKHGAPGSWQLVLK